MQSLIVARNGNLTHWYQSFLEQAETGDLVMFSGRNLTSVFIEILTDTPNSHLALVIRDRQRNVFGLLEAVRHGDSCRDLMCDRTQCDGVRLVDAVQRLSLYNGKFCTWRQLHGYDGGCPQNQARVWRSICHYWGRRYERSTLQLWRSPLQLACLRNSEADTSSFFCSELVAQLYMDMGLLDDSKRPSNCYVPGK